MTRSAAMVGTLPGHRRAGRFLAAAWVAGAAGVLADAVTGPFTAAVFLPSVVLCLATSGALLWAYRRVLFHFATGLDEREKELRARVYHGAFAVVAASMVLIWLGTTMLAREHTGWHLKEVWHLVPLILLWAPGAAAGVVLPAADED